jgi:5-methylthioadenosine/S-adenosylhomocysteine deaminase
MLDLGISVSLGADGAACNNRLDMFTEMRSMALLQKALRGPEVLPARSALRIATIEGAKALGLQNEIGSLEVGKRADVAVVKVEGLDSTPSTRDLVSALVYSGQTSDVQAVVVDGRLLMNDRKLLTIDEAGVVSEAEREAGELRTRAGLND